MGWRDDPIVGSQQPARPWQDDPIVGEQPPSKPVGDIGDAIMEPLRSLGSSALSAPVAGVAGLASAVPYGLGLTKTHPGDVVRNVHGALTYEPRTQAGDKSTDVVNYPFEKLAQGADYVGGKTLDATGSPALAAAVNTAIQAAPALLLKGRGKPAEVRPNVSSAPRVDRPVAPSEAQAKAPPATGRQPRLAEVPESPSVRAREAKYILKPSETGAKAGAVVEGLTGSAKFETSAVKRNQRNTDRLVREEFGLPSGPITKEAINKLRAPHNAVYGEVSRLGEVPTTEAYRAEIANVGRTPGQSFQKDINKSVEELKAAYIDEQSFVASDAVLKVRELRYKSGKNIGSRDPAAQELGYAQRAIADAIDNQLEHQAQALGKTKLVERYRAARQELAKLHSLQIAARGGEVSAPILAKQMEKGVPLSGNLKTIAQVATDFPNVMREGRKVKGGTPVNMAETAIGIAGLASAQPALVAAMAARPLTRRVMMSERYQNSLAKPQEPANRLRKEEKRKAMLEY